MKTDNPFTKVRLMDTGQLLKKLANKYPAPAYAFLTQVRNGTGFLNITRTADAMVMSLWPSRGLELMGFEIKASRSDWLRELKNPEKAEEMMSFCDRWYVVAANNEIIKPDEIPPTWGFMSATGRSGSMKIVKEAPQLKPQECDRFFLASIMRNITERMISRDLVDVEISKARKEIEGDNARHIERLERESEDRQKAIEDFEKISGLRISTWEDGNHELAKAVKDVREGRYKKADEALRDIKKSAIKIAKYVDKEIQSYEL